MCHQFYERLVCGTTYIMIYLLLLTNVAIAAGTEEAQPAESTQPIRVLDDQRGYQFEDGLELIHRRQELQRKAFEEQRDSTLHGHQRGPQRLDIKEDDHSGPVILRTLNPHNPGHIDIERQNKIIADAYAPDYYQPTWLLDYRYLKTGGRDYTRGPGGQILILPKNIRTNEHKEFTDFDSLLEHLRLSRIAERAKYSRDRDEHDDRRSHQNYGQYNREHQPDWQKGYRRL